MLCENCGQDSRILFDIRYETEQVREGSGEFRTYEKKGLWCKSCAVGIF